MATITPDEARSAGLSLDSANDDVQALLEAVQQFSGVISANDFFIRAIQDPEAALEETRSKPNSTWYKPEVTELAEETTAESLQQTFQQARLGSQTAIMDIVYLSAMIDPTRQPEAQAALADFAAEIVGLNNSGAINIDDNALGIIERIAPAGQTTVDPTPVNSGTPDVVVQVNERIEAQINAGLDPEVLLNASQGDEFAIMDLGIQVFEMTSAANPNLPALQEISFTFASALEEQRLGNLDIPQTSIDTMMLSLEKIGFIDIDTGLDLTGAASSQFIAELVENGELDVSSNTVVEDYVAQEPALVEPSQEAPIVLGTPVILPNGEPLVRNDNGAVVTREDIQTSLMEMNAADANYGLDQYQQGLTYLNPAYEEFFVATEVTAGVFNNSVLAELQIAFNEDPATLQQFIDLADDPESLALLTTRIQAEQGATDLTQALAEVTNRRGLGETEPAPVVDGIINNQIEIQAGVAPTAPNSDFTPYVAPAAPAPLQAPAPDVVPTLDEAPALAASANSVITVEFNAVTNVADANVLLNGIANDDMAHIRQVIEEARAMGVDPALIDRVEGQINVDISQFVTTQSATAATIAYSASLHEALENDGRVSEAEYAGALSSYFTQISTGIVEDRAGAGLTDDIAAEAGMDVAAQEFMSQIREAVASSGVAPSAPPPAPETIRYASMNL